MPPDQNQEPVRTLDRLVRLYDLPNPSSALAKAKARGVIVRRARAYEKQQVIDWVRAYFSEGWASECDVAFAREPVGCFLATHNGRIVGFACIEATMKNFFGPTGVDSAFQGSGIGAALLLSSLDAMRQLGYAYAIIGGPREAAPFYRHVANAVDIEGSHPGIYIDRLIGSDS